MSMMILTHKEKRYMMILSSITQTLFLLYNKHVDVSVAVDICNISRIIKDSFLLLMDKVNLDALYLFSMII